MGGIVHHLGTLSEGLGRELDVSQFIANCVRQLIYLATESHKCSIGSVDMGLGKRTTIIIDAHMSGSTQERVQKWKEVVKRFASLTPLSLLAHDSS